MEQFLSPIRKWFTSVAPVGISNQGSHCGSPQGSKQDMTGGYFFPLVVCMKLASRDEAFWLVPVLFFPCSMIHVCHVSNSKVFL